MFNKNKVNLLINCCAIGDTICVIPTVLALLKEGRLNKILSNKKWDELFSLFDIPREIITYMNDDSLTPFDPNDHIIIPAYPENRAPYRMHLTDFFSYNLAYATLTPKEKSIKVDQRKLIDTPVSSRYVVMQGSTRLRSRTLLPAEWTKIKEYLFSKGLDVVVLGDPLDKSDYDTSGCITEFMGCNLTTSISICNGAKAVIGVDGGLIYIASLTDTPIIAGYSFVDPDYRAPYRNSIKGWNFKAVHPRGKCTYCTNSLCAFGIEFDVACPNQIDFDCIKTLVADDFIFQIENGYFFHPHKITPYQGIK